MSHEPFTPFPTHGEPYIWQRREAWKIVTSFAGKWPWYAIRERWSAKWGDWPFFAFRLGKLHGYLGYKPINLQDQHFYVPNDFNRDQSAVELSARLGWGVIS